MQIMNNAIAIAITIWLSCSRIVFLELESDINYWFSVQNVQENHSGTKPMLSLDLMLVFYQ